MVDCSGTLQSAGLRAVERTFMRSWEGREGDGGERAAALKVRFWTTEGEVLS